MHDAVTTFLFTDIEGSTRLWEQEPERMRHALARHDAIVRGAVDSHGGSVVKMTGDGVHAAFDDALGAILCTLELQRSLADPQLTAGLELRVRCGLHAGHSEGRDGDFYGTVVNRAARIMAAAHGGQVLASQAVVEKVATRLPSPVSMRDLGFVRLRDLGGAERLFQLVAPPLRQDFPALRSLEGTPNNLPQAVASFVGRAREIAEVDKLLTRHRLVTLVGMGGLGKTRLSLHVAAESMDAYPDGVWLVELGPLREAHRVALAVAATLGVKDEAGRPIEDALARHVKDRTLLVILDNCEHLLESSATVARHLLSSGANVRVLATAREPLRIAGESSYVISGLPVPGPLEATVPGALAQYASVQLFTDRAAAAVPGFELDADNATAIAAICHRLDGIPLAIELAAARTRSLSVMQIAARLKDRFRLLTSGDPTAMPRQRTLRALIDWSHDLLPDDERRLFRRLAVFAGGWTLEAAEAVCADGEDDAVLDLVARLVEKCLVEFDEPSLRYRMLETVREYALERLGATDEAGALRARHLDYFTAFAERAKPHLAGPEQREWIARLDLERENLLSAHEFAGRDAASATAGLRLVNALKLFWISRGLVELGHAVTVAALDRNGTNGPTVLRAQGLFHAGHLLYAMGRYAEAKRRLEESLAIARAMGSEQGIATVLQPLGMSAMGEGDMETARACLEEALQLAERRAEKRSLAAAINALAQFHRVDGRAAASLPMFERVQALARELGDGQAEAVGGLNHAMVMIDQGDSARAAAMTLAALELSSSARSSPVLQSVLEVAAGLAALMQEWERAARFYGAAEAQARASGVRRDPADELFLAPRINAVRASLGASAFDHAAAEGGRLELAAAVEEARRWLSTITVAKASAGESVVTNR